MQYRRFLISLSVCLASASLWSNNGHTAQWEVLFDGKDLSRWKAMGENQNAWRVTDGVLRVLHGGQWLSTIEEFDDFELQLDFRLVSAGANSGVFIRAPREGYPADAGLEIQLLDDDAKEHRDLKPYQYTGSIYGIAAPTSKASKPVGQWQQLRIVCNGPMIRVALNGTEVIDVNLDEHTDQKDRHPGVLRRRGHIGLQSYGKPGEVNFRNIRIRKLTSSGDH